MDTLELINIHNAWYIKDDHGTHMVKFHLGDIGWKVVSFDQFDGGHCDWNSIRIGFEMFSKIFSIEFQINGDFEIRDEDNKQLDKINLSARSPFVSFFKKIGRHVKTNELLVIPINHSFDKQLY